jgi:hypothetical protein
MVRRGVTTAFDLNEQEGVWRLLGTLKMISGRVWGAVEK